MFQNIICTGISRNNPITSLSFYYYYYITSKRNQRGVAIKDIGANPIFICVEVIKAYTDILKHIKAGQFIYILVLLELLLSKQFHYILTQPTFRLYISLAIINKYYLVTNQTKSFQPYYAQLFKVRLLLSLIVPQFIYTITLNKETYIKVIKLVGFYQNITDLK